MRFAADQKEHQIAEYIEYLAQKFNLTPEERKELTPSGTDFLFDGRVRWARLCLSKAGLLEYTERGFFKITQRGLQVLASNPSKIDDKLLEQFPEFKEYLTETY
jgi:restriction system protein